VPCAVTVTKRWCEYFISPCHLFFNRLSISLILMLCGKRGLGMRLPVYLMSCECLHLSVQLWPSILLSEWCVRPVCLLLPDSQCLCCDCFQLSMQASLLCFQLSTYLSSILLSEWYDGSVYITPCVPAFSLQTQSCIMHVLWYDFSLRSHALLTLWSGEGQVVACMCQAYSGAPPQCIALI